MNRMMDRFAFDHLPEDLMATSALIAATAKTLDEKLPDSDEKTEAMIKLWEAKNCFVYAIVAERFK